MCISVDLPEPEGPITAVSSPRGNRERDAAERVHGRVAGAVAAGEAGRSDDGAGLLRPSRGGRARVQLPSGERLLRVGSALISEARPRRAQRHRPRSRLRVVREDDLGVVRADDAVPTPVEYRFNVTRRPLAWAKALRVRSGRLVGVVVTQIDIWSNVEDNRIRLAAIALVTAGALLFRRRAPFVAPLVVAAGAFAFTFVDPSAAYDTDTMFLPLVLAAWAAGSLLDWRLAVAALAAILAAGWTGLHPRPRRPVDGVDLAQLPAHRHLRALGCRGAGTRSRPGGRGAGSADRGGGAPSRSRKSGTGSRASCTTCSRTRSA